MKSALDVHQALLGADVAHEMVRLPSVASTAADLPHLLALDPAACVVVHCLLSTGDAAEAACDQLVAVLLRAGDRLDHDAVGEVVGGPVRPAPSADVSAVTDFPSGLVSPIGLPGAVRVLADTGLGGRDVLYCAAGEGGVALGMRTRDLLVACRATVGGFAVRDGARHPARRVGTPPAGALPEPRRSAAVAPR